MEEKQKILNVRIITDGRKPHPGEEGRLRERSLEVVFQCPERSTWGFHFIQGGHIKPVNGKGVFAEKELWQCQNGK